LPSRRACKKARRWRWRPDESLDDALERLERELIQNALEQNNFNLTRAAERLKLTRHSLALSHATAKHENCRR
jgi:transcriptional regulator with PAS, ATPase and Fis domain